MTHTSSAKVTGTTNAQILETAHLSADSIRVQDVELQEIIDNVETDGLTPAKLVQRETIGENDYYILTDDTGQPVEIHLPSNIFPKWANNTGLKYVNWSLENAPSWAPSIFENCKNLKEVKTGKIPIESTDRLFYNCTSLEKFEGDLSSLKVQWGTFGNTNLKELNIELPELQSGARLLTHTPIEKFEIDLPKTTYLSGAFASCSQLKSVKSNFSALTAADWAFSYCTNLENLDIVSLSNLIDGAYMFQSCHKLTSFTYDISSVQNGDHMFASCLNLTNFSSPLTSLTNCSWMFEYTKLNKDSIMNIVKTLREDNICETTPIGTMIIGVDATLKNDRELLEFLGIENVSNSTFIVTNPKGINWTLSIQWR